MVHTLDSGGFMTSRFLVNPALNPLVCGCLNCLRRFRDSRSFRESYQVASHAFLANHSFRST